MELYPVDIEPAQILRWVLAEQEVAPTRLKATATRAAETHELPTRKEARLGDQEQNELSEVATLATLQIRPADPAEGWSLTITVEDEVGPRLLADSSGVEPEQEIGIGEFFDEFVRPGRGVANAVAEAENPAAEERLNRLLEYIETNRHTAKPGGA